MGNAHHPIRPTQEDKQAFRTSQRGDDRTQAASSLSGNPAAVQPRHILHLQRTIGNQQVQRLLTATPTGVIQREDVETETVRLSIWKHSSERTTAKLKGIDPASIVRVTVNYEEIPEGKWEVAGKYLYIDVETWTEPNVHVDVKKGATPDSSTDETQGSIAEDATAESQDTSIDSHNESDTSSHETTSTENTSASSAEAGKSDFENDKDYKAYLLEEIWKAIEEKGIAGAHVQQGMIKRLEIEQLEYLLHEVVKKADSDEKKKAVDDEIEELLGG